jgi:diguanylate cyclase (GGDEF)-like protein/PAS domain S-box-containing protein
MQRIIPAPDFSADYEFLFKLTFEQAPSAIAHLSLDGQWIRCNRAFCEMLGYPGDEMPAKSFQQIFWSEDAKGKLNPVSSMQKGEVESFEIQKYCLKKDGESLWAGISMKRISDSRHSPSFVVVNVENLQSLKTEEAALQEDRAQLAHILDTVDTGALDDAALRSSAEKFAYMACHDSLTGLPNRRYLSMKLERSLDRARRRKEMLAVLFLDLDSFKQVNDSMGHECGDQLLKEVVSRLQQRLRKDDFIVRFGGDEFVLVLDDEVSEQNTWNLATTLIQLVGAPYELGDGKTAQIGLSIGIAFFPKDGSDLPTLLQNADNALYQSKEAGRGTWTSYEG